MSYGLIIVLAIIIFLNRYVFLEPKVSVRLPKFIERMLSFSAPCLLSVICVPIIFSIMAGNCAIYPPMHTYMPQYFQRY